MTSSSPDHHAEDLAGDLAGDPCASLKVPPGQPFAVGQMGQSLDGFIATRTGASHYVTGQESLVHLHRMRALVDGVVVGWRTALADDPQLTVRLVEGEDPARVIVDLDERLGPELRAFRPGARVLHVVGDDRPDGAALAGHVERVLVPRRDGRVEPSVLLRTLREQGLARLLIEGGGALVSAFVQAGVLDRLHVVVAPLLIGQGRPGVQVVPVDELADALRPPARVHRLGSDVLFDLDLSRLASGQASGQPSGQPSG